jgi:DNA-binding CsgD family transcriptional regulator
LAAHRLLGELETAAEQTSTAVAHLTAALDLAEVCEAPFERALTLLSLAELRVRTDEWADAEATLDEARRICTPIRAELTIRKINALADRFIGPATVRASPAGLTQREVEVLRLVAEHLTDKEIAAQLFVGVRTVQTHVTNILGKLGVENRRKAAAEARRLGLT